MRILILLLLLLPSATFAADGRKRNTVNVETIKVTDNIYMLRGRGGNIGVVTGPDHVVMIDSQFAPLSDKIKAAVKQISDKPIRLMVNTHYHGDHTGGNENFAKAGVVIAAHEHVRERLAKGTTIKARDAVVDAKAGDALPVLTYKDGIKLYQGAEELELIHLPNAHTDGDTAIFFPKSNVIHTGDIYFVGVVPFIDVENGGDYLGYIKAMEAILARADENTKIIPGHGPLATKAMMLRDLEKVKEFDPTKK